MAVSPRVWGPVAAGLLAVAGLAAHAALLAVVSDPRQAMVAWGLCAAWVVVSGYLFSPGAGEEAPSGATGTEEILADVREMAQAAGTAVPRVQLHHDERPIAYATRTILGPELGISTGFLDDLPPAERTAILAHEVAHLRTYDGLVHSAGTYILATSGLPVLWSILLGGVDPLWQVLGVVGYVGMLSGPWWLGVLAMALGGFLPLVPFGLQAVVSRWREYVADRRAAALTGDPDTLALALGNVAVLGETRWDPLGSEFPPTYSAERTQLDHLLADHPPLDRRIRRLVRTGDNDN